MSLLLYKLFLAYDYHINGRIKFYYLYLLLSLNYIHTYILGEKLRINKFFENCQYKIMLSKVSVVYTRKKSMNNDRNLTKEIIVSGNVDLLHCVYLYLLIHTIIYIYLVGMARRILLSATTSTKTSQTLVVPFPLIFFIQ